MSATHVEVAAAASLARVSLRGSLLVPRLIGRGPARAAVALTAGGAMLLGGDTIELGIIVGPGCTLVLEDVGGTVAYDGDGRSSGWTASVSIGEGGTLVWHGSPFVVSDGADVRRTTSVMLHPGARLLLRETIVLGRADEAGGRLFARTEIRSGVEPVLIEELTLDGRMPMPGVLGRARVLDAIIALGAAHSEPLASVDVPDASFADLRTASGGRLLRSLGTSAHRVDLSLQWGALLPGFAPVDGTRERSDATAA